MGNDGGSIPDRRDLVRNKPKVCIAYLINCPLSNRYTGRTSRQSEPDPRQMVLLRTVQG